MPGKLLNYLSTAKLPDQVMEGICLPEATTGIKVSSQ